jgi:uncharacterized protein YhaN
MKKIQDFGQFTFVNEKWSKKVKIEKTGEHADKTVSELKKELRELKDKSKSYQEKDEKVPKSIIEKESEIKFAIRAKKHWPKGEDSM